MKVLVTGGTGYVGSHVTVELLQSGYEVVIVDDLSNSEASVAKRIATIAGRSLELVETDMADQSGLETALAKGVSAVIHCAGLKAVGESSRIPLDYYQANVAGTISLLSAMTITGVNQLVFSSSATVYGQPTDIPVTEQSPTTQPTNPYGWTKLMIEQILSDLQQAQPEWRMAILRYFNPVGAHPSAQIGEQPRGTPNNLTPYIAQVAAGWREELPVYGNDYPTPDGTGVRDYIHVMDLSQGHLAALEFLDQRPGYNVWNLGTGQGTSVLELVECFEQVTGQKVPYRIYPRREGDIAACWTDPQLANRQLGWRATHTTADMCADLWRWQQSWSRLGSAEPGPKTC